MAKKKISGLPAGSALNGTELVPIVQTGTTKRITTQDIADLGNASGVEGSGTINNLAKFTASSTIGDSKFFDDGTNQGIETTTAVNRFIMSANASIAKIFSFRSANLPRWAFRVDGTESGANAGADLSIRRYDDAGNYIDSPMTMDRSDGKITILKDATINGVTVGKGAGNIAGNTAVGFEAAYSNTTETGITAIGYQALRLSTGVNNTAVGNSTLTSNSTGSYNSAVGVNALLSNTTGYSNSVLGLNAMLDNTTGSFNCVIGLNASLSNTTGNSNSVLGYQALRQNSTGGQNCAFGEDALFYNTASNNVAMGYQAAFTNTTGTGITAIGYQALKLNTSDSNVALGNSALAANTTGFQNTAIGSGSGSANTTGSNNNIIGQAQQTGNFNNTSMIGVGDTATASNQMRFGSATIVNGAVATEVLVSDRSWSVFINGTAYKILLKA